jgi:hypothetical protein
MADVGVIGVPDAVRSRNRRADVVLKAGLRQRVGK